MRLTFTQKAFHNVLFQQFSFTQESVNYGCCNVTKTSSPKASANGKGNSSYVCVCYSSDYNYYLIIIIMPRDIIRPQFFNFLFRFFFGFYFPDFLRKKTERARTPENNISVFIYFFLKTLGQSTDFYIFYCTKCLCFKNILLCTSFKSSRLLSICVYWKKP